MYPSPFLFIGSDSSALQLGVALQGSGSTAENVPCVGLLEGPLNGERFQGVFVQVDEKDGASLDCVIHLKGIGTPLILVTAPEDICTWAAARLIKAGAADILIEPLREQDVLEAISRGAPEKRLPRRRANGSLVSPGA